MLRYRLDNNSSVSRTSRLLNALTSASTFVMLRYCFCDEACYQNHLQSRLVRRNEEFIFLYKMGIMLRLARDFQLVLFSEAFDGVILAFNEDIQSKTAKILPGIVPYFGVRVKAKLLVFSPKPDMILEGKVVKLGKESIHVIVLGFSSAAITFEDIREELKYKIQHGEGVFASMLHKRHVIKVGSMLRFLVKSFDEEILHISGSLVPAHTGCIHWLHKHTTEEGSQMDRSHRKRREKVVELEMPEHKLEVHPGFTSSIHRHKSKRKRTAEAP